MRKNGAVPTASKAIGDEGHASVAQQCDRLKWLRSEMLQSHGLRAHRKPKPSLE